MDQTKKEIAYHKAGHAVIAYRLGLPVGPLTIVPTDHYLGRSSTEGEWADGSLDREQIVVLFAGYSAQCRYNLNADAGGSDSDNEKAERLLEFQPLGAEQELQAITDCIVEENWLVIGAVADALLEYEALVEGWEIIVDAIDEGQDWRSMYSRYLRLCPGSAAA